MVDPQIVGNIISTQNIVAPHAWSGAGRLELLIALDDNLSGQIMHPVRRLSPLAGG